jgi:hypothetical protein
MSFGNQPYVTLLLNLEIISSLVTKKTQAISHILESS